MTTDNKTMAVDVLAVMASVWHQGLDVTNVRDFEKARAAVAELIDKVDSYVTLGDSDTAYRELSAALARVKGESA